MDEDGNETKVDEDSSETNVDEDSNDSSSLSGYLEKVEDIAPLALPDLSPAKVSVKFWDQVPCIVNQCRGQEVYTDKLLQQPSCS